MAELAGKNATRIITMDPNCDKTTIILVALAIIAVMNTAAFVLTGHDKRCARQGNWRVPEKTLFLVKTCFGGLGGVPGMKVF